MPVVTLECFDVVGATDVAKRLGRYGYADESQIDFSDPDSSEAEVIQPHPSIADGLVPHSLAQLDHARNRIGSRAVSIVCPGYATAATVQELSDPGAVLPDSEEVRPDLAIYFDVPQDELLLKLIHHEAQRRFRSGRPDTGITAERHLSRTDTLIVGLYEQARRLLEGRLDAYDAVEVIRTSSVNPIALANRVDDAISRFTAPPKV